MNLLRYIRCRDRVSPRRVTDGGPILIESSACPGQLWVASVIPQLSIHLLQASVCSDIGASCLKIHSLRREIGGEYEGCFCRGSANKSLRLELRPLPQNTGPWCNIIIGLYILPESVWILGRCCSFRRLPGSCRLRLSKAWRQTM